MNFNKCKHYGLKIVVFVGTFLLIAESWAGACAGYVSKECLLTSVKAAQSFDVGLNYSEVSLSDGLGCSNCGCGANFQKFPESADSKTFSFWSAYQGLGYQGIPVSYSIFANDLKLISKNSKRRNFLACERPGDINLRDVLELLSRYNNL